MSFDFSRSRKGKSGNSHTNEESNDPIALSKRLTCGKTDHMYAITEASYWDGKFFFLSFCKFNESSNLFREEQKCRCMFVKAPCLESVFSFITLFFYFCVR